MLRHTTLLRNFSHRLTKVLRRIERKIERHGYRSPLRRDAALHQKLSVVSPLHNVAPYLEQFLASLTSQSTGLKNVEIILVDDGSKDATGEIARTWARRFPRAIRYVRQENQGVASARNHGLRLATGNWVTFPDPDDYLSPNYFATINDELGRQHKQPLLMISMKLVYVFDSDGRVADTHPLKHRYRQARTERSSWQVGDFIQLSINNVCIERAAVLSNGIAADPRIRPSFEDAHFINRLLLAEPNRSVVFRNSAIYHYRKRADQSSLLDGSRTHSAWYGDQLRYGVLDLLERATRDVGHVPKFLQTTILYEVFWRFRHLAGNDAPASFLTEQQRAEFLELLGQIFAYIDPATILEQSIGGLHEEHRVALLAMFKGRTKSPVVYLRQIDPGVNLLQITHFTATGQVVEPRVAGRIVAAKFKSRREVRFLGRHYFQENRFWIEAPAPTDEITFRVDGADAELRVGSAKHGMTTSLERAGVALRPKPDPTAMKESGAAAVRRHARSATAAARFDKCWLLMDRDDAADDNAEYFYRYLMRTGRGSRAFFVLRPDCPDWARLSKQGFKLVAWRSHDHAAALANAAFLISSHLDEFIRWPFPPGVLRDLVTYRYVFLQHGVTKDDISRWVNAKAVSLFLTASRAEYESISAHGSNYLLSEKEVKLTGFPRHDSLVGDVPAGTKIMIMPTWRHSLVGASLGVGMKRSKSAAMLQSDYFLRWKSVLNSARLRHLSETSGAPILFCPHPNLADYIEDFKLSAHIETRDPRQPPSLQTSLKESAVLITDFSSIAFDMAYLDRPVLYYQFDRASIFSGGHLFDKGYFDYDRDGFGSVALDEDALLENLETVLAGWEDPQYGRRRHDTFAFRDGKCCERVYQAILELSHPQERTILRQIEATS